MTIQFNSFDYKKEKKGYKTHFQFDISSYGLTKGGIWVELIVCDWMFNMHIYHFTKKWRKEHRLI